MHTTAKLREVDYLKAWAFFWVLSTLGGALAGAIGGALLGFILGGLGVHMRTIRYLCGGFGFLLGLPISYLLFQFTIRMFLVPKLSAREEAGQT